MWWTETRPPEGGESADVNPGMPTRAYIATLEATSISNDREETP